MMNIADETRLQLASGAVAAGTTTVNGAVHDLTAVGGVRLIAAFGDCTDTAVVTVKFQTGTKSDASDMADVTGASVSFTADATSLDSKIMTLDIVGLNPQKRYGRFVIVRGTANSVILSAVTELYALTNVPGTMTLDVVAKKIARGG